MGMTAHFRSTWLRSLALAAVVTAASARMVDEPREHFPPDPQVEWRRVELSLRFEDLDDPSFVGSALYTFRAAGQRVERLRLDAGDLEVTAVQEVGGKGRTLEWSHADDVLQVRLADPIGPHFGGAGDAAAEDHRVRIDYRVRDPRRGMTFSPALPTTDGAPAAAAEVHTQGQPQSNHHWFPVHDFPNVRLATELIVDVPQGVSVSGNGRLVKHESQGMREKWHWVQDEPHVPYLVSLVAGNFQRTELAAPLSGVPMAVWTRPDHAAFARGTYASTDRMMKVFERVFGVAYPWARYDQLVVRNFAAGGMENTSATTMNAGALLDATSLVEGDLDGLISHELCHQWTGDLITCRSWEHIWLNEGWATYGTALWMEERDGVDGYYDQVLGSAGVAGADSAAAAGTPPLMPQAMCSRVYGSPGETFRRNANPYPKGASVLHMLRRRLGDDAFFRGVHLYFKRFGGRLAETADFRRCLEEVSGSSLEEFFEQWCFRPGSPEIGVKASYDPAPRRLRIEVTQSMRNAAAPWMRFDLPVVVRTASGDRTVAVSVDGAASVREVELDGPPTMVAVDPMLDVLKVLSVDLPDAWLIEQLRAGPTSAARRQAARALAKRESPSALEALAAVAADSGVRASLRSEAVEAIAAYGSPSARESMTTLFDRLVVPALGKPPAENEKECPATVRASIAASMGAVPFEQSRARLTDALQRENGYAVRTSACEALRRLGGVDFAEQRTALQGDAALRSGLERMLEQGIPSERVRIAALETISALQLNELRARVESLAQLGFMDRMRSTAIGTLAELTRGSSDTAQRAETVRLCMRWLTDPELRARDAAGEALAKLAAREALPDIDAIAASDRDPRARDRAREWARTIRDAAAKPAPKPAVGASSG